MSDLFSFRRYKRKEGKKQVKHPKLIVDEFDNAWGYMGLTEEKKKGKNHRNIPLSVNPKKGDKRPAYLRRKIEYDNKKQFGQVLHNYNLSNVDKEKVKDYVNKHKKR